MAAHHLRQSRWIYVSSSHACPSAAIGLSRRRHDEWVICAIIRGQVFKSWSCRLLSSATAPRSAHACVWSVRIPACLIIGSADDKAPWQLGRPAFEYRYQGGSRACSSSENNRLCQQLEAPQVLHHGRPFDRILLRSKIWHARSSITRKYMVRYECRVFRLALVGWMLCSPHSG